MSHPGRVRVHPPPKIVSVHVGRSTCDRIKNVHVATASDSWTISHQTVFRFRINVTVEPDVRAMTDKVMDLREVAKPGDTLGLVQTLVSSERVATYEGGVQCAIKPACALPCLDARNDESTMPFYDGREGIKLRVPALRLGQNYPISFTLDIDDDPSWEVPIRAKHTTPSKIRGKPPTVVLRNIQSVKTVEKFYITLYNKDSRKIVAQWDWTYNYTVRHQNNAPVVTAQDSAFAIKRSPVAIPLGGTVAGDQVTKTWSQGWGPVWR